MLNSGVLGDVLTIQICLFAVKADVFSGPLPSQHPCIDQSQLVLGISILKCFGLDKYNIIRLLIELLKQKYSFD